MITMIETKDCMITWKHTESKLCSFAENGEGDVPVASKRLFELVSGNFHKNGMLMVSEQKDFQYDIHDKSWGILRIIKYESGKVFHVDCDNNRRPNY